MGADHEVLEENSRLKEAALLNSQVHSLLIKNKFN